MDPVGHLDDHGLLCSAMEPAPYLSDEVLSRLPVLPMPSSVLFPGTELTLEVFEPSYRELVRYSLGEDRAMLVGLVDPGRQDTVEPLPVLNVAGAGSLVAAEKHPDGRYNITLWGTDRVRIVEELEGSGGIRLARCERLRDMNRGAGDLASAERCLRNLAIRVAGFLPDVEEQILEALSEIEEGTGAFADCVACRLVPCALSRQAVLEELDVMRRVRLVTKEVAEICLKVDPTCKEGFGPTN